jgi:hypothetical protein
MGGAGQRERGGKAERGRAQDGDTPGDDVHWSLLFPVPMLSGGGPEHLFETPIKYRHKLFTDATRRVPVL